MLKPNDSILDEIAYRNVCKEADKILAESDSLGIFPTPIDQILHVAKVEEVPDKVLDASFLDSMKDKAQGALKSALKKVLGLYDAVSRLIFIDRNVMRVKQDFIRLHEAGHAYMPWQDQAYLIVEECSGTLSSDVADQFDVEANVFASQVLFQNDAFINEASDHAFSISVPRDLSKKFGASIYASIRQYVAKSYHCCTVLVLNSPEYIPGDGFRASKRRIICSERFLSQFPADAWPAYFTSRDEIGKLVPHNGRKMSGKRTLGLTDNNGELHEFVGEAFTNSYQVFVLLHKAKALTASRIIF